MYSSAVHLKKTIWREKKPIKPHASPRLLPGLLGGGLQVAKKLQNWVGSVPWCPAHGQRLYVYICICINIYICIWRERERDRSRKKESNE